MHCKTVKTTDSFGSKVCLVKKLDLWMRSLVICGVEKLRKEIFSDQNVQTINTQRHVEDNKGLRLFGVTQRCVQMIRGSLQKKTIICLCGRMQYIRDKNKCSYASLHQFILNECGKKHCFLHSPRPKWASSSTSLLPMDSSIRSWESVRCIPREYL